MTSAKYELEEIVKLYTDGEKLMAYLSLTTKLMGSDSDEVIAKNIYRHHYFHKPNLFELSVYFLSLCNQVEKDILLLEWLELSLDQFSNHQKTQILEICKRTR